MPELAESPRIAAVFSPSQHAYGHEVLGSGVSCDSWCPVHGSMFGLHDGKVLRGPAMQPFPAYDARVNGDPVETRRMD